MMYAQENYTKNKIKLAGKILKQQSKASVTEIDEAFRALVFWRKKHLYPMNTFRATLEQRVKKCNFSESTNIVQRLKRTDSIVTKLNRYPSMALPNMQDIAGFRVILASNKDVQKLRNIYKKGRLAHKLIKENNYTKEPKLSGYRGIHLVYKYKNPNPNLTEYNGLFIELQFRTEIQHIWATAVEIMGTYVNTSLKSSEGLPAYLEFFRLASAAFAHKESLPTSSKYLLWGYPRIIEELFKKAKILKIQDKLQGFRMTTNILNRQVEKNAGGRFLVVLDSKQHKVSIKSFSTSTRGSQAAIEEYTKRERENKNNTNINVVLVSAKSIKALKQAYPNYFLDGAKFLELLKNMENDLKDPSLS